MGISELRSKFLFFIIFAGILTVFLVIIPFVESPLKEYVANFFGTTDGRMGETAATLLDQILRIIKIILWMSLIISIIRFIDQLIFSTAFRSDTYEISSLLRNVFSIILYIVAFFVVFNSQYPGVDLAALFTTSTILGVIIGLALQDTLGNLFSGLAIQADQPFQIGDVVSIPTKGTGVVESISWRGVAIRTFQNKILVISNSVLGKESIEVAPRENLNARLVFFNTLYANSPAKTIQTVREIVRQIENVSPKIRPIVRIRNLGDNGLDFEVKYWLEDYAKYNDTDALVRQRIWYAFQREKIEFAYPTRTLHIKRQPATNSNGARQKINNGIVERLAAVDIFAPLSGEELARLSANVESHVFAPGETIIRAGEKGASMFVVNRGEVEVQVSDDGQSRIIASLEEGDFFGEMGLFTGAPRTASIIAAEETEVFQIDHTAIKPLFDTNPDLVEALSHTIAERRTALDARKPEQQELEESTGLLASIKRFFGLDSD